MGWDLPDDFHGVIVRVEGVHQNQGHVGIVPKGGDLRLELKLGVRKKQEKGIG